MPKGVYPRTEQSKNHKGCKHTEEAKRKMKNKTSFKYGQEHPKWNNGKMKSGNGYISILIPEHPHANKYGRVLEHRLVMEKSLGRYLSPVEVVHHKGRKNDNRIEKLMLFKDENAHRAYHKQLRLKLKSSHK